MQNVEGKTAIVNVGASGIGLDIAMALPRVGMKGVTATYLAEVLADYRAHPQNSDHDWRIAVEAMRRQAYKAACVAVRNLP